jgi:hypothetical protein
MGLFVYVVLRKFLALISALLLSMLNTVVSSEIVIEGV